MKSDKIQWKHFSVSEFVSSQSQQLARLRCKNKQKSSQTLFLLNHEVNAVFL